MTATPVAGHIDVWRLKHRLRI